MALRLEFNVEGLCLMGESDMPPADISEELGIRRNQLYNQWRNYWGQTRVALS